jgi:hypothetical protein
MILESKCTILILVVIKEHKDTREKNSGAERLRGSEFKSGDLKWRRLLLQTYLLPFITE